VRNLWRGDRGKEVLDVQTRLRGQGFELGREGVDGFFGPSTELAVRSFQQQRGLLVDAVVGANTWRELVEAGHALGDRLLYLREPPFRGDDVLALQVKLNLLGFNAGAERGMHDEQVERAVLDFQRNAGLAVDGIVGESTLLKLEALRKAESGREGKKIPERDGGFTEARRLSGQTVVIDPGHGGPDAGFVSGGGVPEKEVTLALGLRLAELLRAEGCRVRLTRERDEATPLYARAEMANAMRAAFLLSLHCNGNEAPDAHGAALYYFQRRHYYSERGQLLGRYVAARLQASGVPCLGGFGRNYGVLRETRGTALLIEPLFLSNPLEERLSRRPDHLETLAQAIRQGLADYLARVPLQQSSSGRTLQASQR
jgi:N-acetylmuramoyl-L-alanine amidase